MKVRPSLAVALAVFVGYVVVWIGTARLIGGSDLEYAEAFKNLDDTRPLVYGLIAGALFGIIVTTAFGWWKEVLGERRTVTGWFRFIPLIVFLAIAATTDWGNFGNIDGSLLAWSAAAGILVGFSEELTFRGLEVVNGRKAKMTEAKVCLVSTVLFGAIHVPNFVLGADIGPSIGQAFLAATTGLLFYISRRTTGTILVPMILHGLWDFTLFTTGDDFSFGNARIVVSLALCIAFLATRKHFFGTEVEPEVAAEPATA
ncbi:MAG: CPBP family intramembrane glutamic endopeptidase [Ilumatobacteraceae bacterium]